MATFGECGDKANQWEYDAPRAIITNKVGLKIENKRVVGRRLDSVALDETIKQMLFVSNVRRIENPENAADLLELTVLKTETHMICVHRRGRVFSVPLSDVNNLDCFFEPIIQVKSGHDNRYVLRHRPLARNPVGVLVAVNDPSLPEMYLALKLVSKRWVLRVETRCNKENMATCESQNLKVIFKQFIPAVTFSDRGHVTEPPTRHDSVLSQKTQCAVAICHHRDKKCLRSDLSNDSEIRGRCKQCVKEIKEKFHEIVLSYPGEQSTRKLLGEKCKALLNYESTSRH